MSDSQSKISIVIITYNRPDDMLQLAQNISQLEHTDLLKEIVIVNNRSTESYEQVENFIANQPNLPFRYFLAPENLGVSRGRNYAIQQSTGQILVFLDDDALFKNKDALLQISTVFEEGANHPRPVGTVSFKVYYYSTMELQQTAFPHKQFEKRKDLHHFDTSYFVGCAHAIDRSVFTTAGYYPDNFFYGMEEYDLSYRTLNAGYAIVYDDRIAVLHKESPSGRLPNKAKLRGMWINKSKVAWKYLPLIYFISTSLMWSLEYLKKSGWDFSGWFKGLTSIPKIPLSEKRTPINSQALSYLKKVQARLWY